MLSTIDPALEYMENEHEVKEGMEEKITVKQLKSIQRYNELMDGMEFMNS